MESFKEAGIDCPVGTCVLDSPLWGDSHRLEQDKLVLGSPLGKYSSINFFVFCMSQINTMTAHLATSGKRDGMLADLQKIRECRMNGQDSRQHFVGSILSKYNAVYLRWWREVQTKKPGMRPYLTATTLSRVGIETLHRNPTLTIVDEVSQATPLRLKKLWRTLMYHYKVCYMYLEDPKQLPPYTQLSGVAHIDVHKSILRRYKCLDEYSQQNSISDLIAQDRGSRLTHILHTRYRMSQCVSAPSNMAFYSGFGIRYPEPNAQRAQKQVTMSQIPNIIRAEAGLGALPIVPEHYTSGYQMIAHEYSPIDQSCYKRKQKAQGIDLNTISYVAISSYRGQIDCLTRNNIANVSTIDSFQGIQADLVFLSLCKANQFTLDAERLCTATTRARLGLVVLLPARSMSDATLQLDIKPEARRWMSHARANQLLLCSRPLSSVSAYLSTDAAPATSVTPRFMPTDEEKDQQHREQKKIVDATASEKAQLRLTLDIATADIQEAKMNTERMRMAYEQAILAGTEAEAKVNRLRESFVQAEGKETEEEKVLQQIELSWKGKSKDI